MASYIKQLKDADGNNIYPIAYVNGGMKMDLIWTNPSPTSSFSPQTISLDLSGYELFMIRILVSATENNTYSGMLIKSTSGQCIPFMLASSSAQGYRIVASITNSGVEFGKGHRGSNDQNGEGIPYQIYGIKMAYIVPIEVQGLEYEEI